ncbi:MAG: molybdopterin molybdenumtransferase MoeA [Anaerolineales bacterium]|nr:molybdopterin molybdenumtransferase MoeA [Anaerolineales bacterium]
MPEFFTVLTPDHALARLWDHLRDAPQLETVDLAEAVGRVAVEAVSAPESVPAFARSTMDGYAVRAQDTFGASPTLPAYLTLAGEAPMGRPPTFSLGPGQAGLIHTGGMLPAGADAVVMIEVTQPAGAAEIEVQRAVAPGENILRVGDDIQAGAAMLPAGHWLRPQDIGGLAALGLIRVAVARQPRVALLATGDEVVPADQAAGPGQVRDVNTYSVAGQIRRAGGVPIRAGIAPDSFKALSRAAAAALAQADALVISAGSSVSVRDMTARVIDSLGAPGTLVHGVAVKPGKPLILAVANGKPVFGLPGNPVSAMVTADLFVVPTVYRLQGCRQPPPGRAVRARLTHNLASQAGRVDYVPARLDYNRAPGAQPAAEPVFGKSNQIFTLVFADGMIVIPMDITGISAGEEVDVRLF